MKVTLIMAMTADGKIARHNSHYPDWTGKEDKRMFKALTTDSGVVIMGSRTYATIGKPLPHRLNVIMTRHPARFSGGTNLIFTSDSPSQILAELASRGYTKASLTGGATISSLFAKDRLIDEMVVTVLHKVFGQGLSLFAEAMDEELELVEYRELEPGVLVLRYKFQYISGSKTTV
jgi:dihydrofolate reductase